MERDAAKNSVSRIDLERISLTNALKEAESTVLALRAEIEGLRDQASSDTTFFILPY